MLEIMTTPWGVVNYSNIVTSRMAGGIQRMASRLGSGLHSIKQIHHPRPLHAGVKVAVFSKHIYALGMLPLFRFFVAFFLTLPMAGWAVNGVQTAPQETDAALRQVVETFRSAIIKKDKPTFMALFHTAQPELVTWQSVLDDDSLRFIQKTRPQSIKARYRPDNNFIAFIDEIVASKTVEEERFLNIQIDTDGDIASISFDYIYLSNGAPTNRGREKWLLVRTEAGWKITSVVYSVRLAEVDKKQ